MDLYRNVSCKTSKLITKNYSTSFSLAIYFLSKEIRKDIYNIYGLVRLVDEVVDTFFDFDQHRLFYDLKKDIHNAIDLKVSTNPILHAFQDTFHRFEIDMALLQSFLSSMEMDLTKKEYITDKEIKNYIYGSADVVGLMCLKVFVGNEKDLYHKLKPYAIGLGTALQEINFLRDLREDNLLLNRSYFPRIKWDTFDEKDKLQIITRIKKGFTKAFVGVKKLPKNSQLAVYIAYRYYRELLNKIEKSSVDVIKNNRVRISNFRKMAILCVCYIRYKLGRL